MTTPDYMAIFRRSMLHNTAHADALNEVAAILCGREMGEIKRRTAGDPAQINDLIDALIDKFVATCEGNERAAVFAALAAYGNAMTAAFGPRGAGGRR